MDVQNVRIEMSAIQLHRKCYDPAPQGKMEVMLIQILAVLHVRNAKNLNKQQVTQSRNNCFYTQYSPLAIPLKKQILYFVVLLIFKNNIITQYG